MEGIANGADGRRRWADPPDQSIRSRSLDSAVRTLTASIVQVTPCYLAVRRGPRSRSGGEEHQTGRERRGDRGGRVPWVSEEPGRPEGERGQQPENRKRDEHDAEQEHQVLFSGTGAGRMSEAPTAAASVTAITASEANTGTL